MVYYRERSRSKDKKCSENGKRDEAVLRRKELSKKTKLKFVKAILSYLH